MTKTYKFDINKFKKALEDTPLQFESIMHDENRFTSYVQFKNGIIRYIRVPSSFSGRNLCINIYLGEGTKKGFWWNYSLDYKSLARHLMSLEKELITTCAEEPPQMKDI